MDLDRLQQAAAHGNADAMAQLANAYEFGLGVAVDADEALRWLRFGAAAGDARCQRDLAERLDPASGNCRGEGDAAEAEHWYQVAITRGNLDAAYPLGRMLLKQGREGEALPWLMLAVERGETAAMRQLAMRAERAGEPTEALEWYRQAAELGDDLAKRELKRLRNRRSRE